MSKKSKKITSQSQKHREQVAARSKTARLPKDPEAREVLWAMEWLLLSEEAKDDWTEKNVHEADDYIAAYNAFVSSKATDFADWAATELLGVYKDGFEGQALGALAGDLEMLVEAIQLYSVDNELLGEGLEKLRALEVINTSSEKGERKVVFTTLPKNWKLKNKYLDQIMSVLAEYVQAGTIPVFRFV